MGQAWGGGGAWARYGLCMPLACAVPLTHCAYVCALRTAQVARDAALSAKSLAQAEPRTRAYTHSASALCAVQVARDAELSAKSLAQAEARAATQLANERQAELDQTYAALKAMTEWVWGRGVVGRGGQEGKWAGRVRC